MLDFLGFWRSLVKYTGRAFWHTSTGLHIQGRQSNAVSTQARWAGPLNGGRMLADVPPTERRRLVDTAGDRDAYCLAVARASWLAGSERQEDEEAGHEARLQLQSL